MKKLFLFVLTIVLLISMSTTVFADVYTDMSSVKVIKSYKLTNAGTNSPPESFNLQQVGDGIVADGEASIAPPLGTITPAVYNAGEATDLGLEKDIIINLPTYTAVGVYEYILRETAGTTAGVAYHGSDIKLVVTVINDPVNPEKLRIAAIHTEGGTGIKSNKIENTYSAGTLEVTKTVTGNLGDKDKYFEFTVTLIGESGKTYLPTYTSVSGSNILNPSTVTVNDPVSLPLTSYTFYLKDGETFSIFNLPYGVSYTVTETDYTGDGYTTTSIGDTGTIFAPIQTASFTNNKDGNVDTGISLDNLPYVLIIGFVIMSGAVLIIRRRKTGK